MKKKLRKQGKKKVERKREELKPGEERNELVTMSRQSILDSISDTGKSTELALSHDDGYVDDDSSVQF